ncbi:unnamed protein product [marine sediment metagenome]|uniref:Uncharacterized protein n=1 Tax=marine sediment metagenome TaxID=412755 RepID=X1QPL8_9ZZZZ
MIIKCFRCDKEIDTPDEHNADYIVAPDTIAKELRETLIALKHNQATLAKEAQMKEVETYLDEDGITELTRPKYPDLAIADSEYDAIEIPNIEASKAIGEDLVKVIAEVKDKDIQKTGIICPKCYKPTDTVIWGVHKKK